MCLCEHYPPTHIISDGDSSVVIISQMREGGNLCVVDADAVKTFRSDSQQDKSAFIENTVYSGIKVDIDLKGSLHQ